MSKESDQLNERQAMWRMLYASAISDKSRLPDELLKGLKDVGITEVIPDLNALSRVLMNSIGWSLEASSGLMPWRDFQGRLKSRVFPIAVELRNNIGYSEGPDVFHDVFGHLPMLVDPQYRECLDQFTRVAGMANSESQDVMCQRFYWYVFEIGLLRNPNGEWKMLGASLISGWEESAHVMRTATKKPFSLQEVVNLPYSPHHFGEIYFFLNSISHIQEAIGELEFFILAQTGE